MSSCKFRNSCHNKRPNFLTQWDQSKVLIPCFFVFTCAHEDSLWTKKIATKQDTQLQSVLQKKTHRISYYIKSNWQIWHHTFYDCQKFLSKKTKFLITMRAIRSFHHYLLCSFQWRFIVKNICMIEQWLVNFRNLYHKHLNTLKKKSIHINQNDFIPEVTVVRFCFHQWCIKQSLISLCHLSM